MYQHPMKMMPPFKGPPMKGPPMKGPQFKGPQYKGPMFKGPMLKGPPFNTPMKGNPWSQPKGPPSNSFNYPMHHFGPPSSSSYPDTPFRPYPAEPEPMPEHQDIHHTENNQEHEHEQENEHIQGPEEIIPEEIPLPPSAAEHHEVEPAGMSQYQTLRSNRFSAYLWFLSCKVHLGYNRYCFLFRTSS